uniref:Uncharacterized protein n=1 Tax=Dulem virus 33 TaxID=3145751 RepID=A0AAU8B704_9CAUD
MNITLKLNDLDLSEKLSTYDVTYEITYRQVITTLDDMEHAYPGAKRPIVTFSLFPLTDDESAELYNTLKDLIIVTTYTNQHLGTDEVRQLRLVSNIESTFALLSVDGKRRYKGGSIQLRGL